MTRVVTERVGFPEAIEATRAVLLVEELRPGRPPGGAAAEAELGAACSGALKGPGSLRELPWSRSPLRLWNINAIGFNSDEAVYAGQAASIVGNSEFLPHFPVFRAHPLLFQATLSLPYQVGVADLPGRLLSVGFGLATVGLVYLLGKELYGRRAGYLAVLLIAVMPYHVVVTRQVLLDGPMTFFATLSLYLLARFAGTGRNRRTRPHRVDQRSRDRAVRARCTGSSRSPPGSGYGPAPSPRPWASSWSPCCRSRCR